MPSAGDGTGCLPACPAGQRSSPGRAASGCWLLSLLVFFVGIDVYMLSLTLDTTASELFAVELWLEVAGSTTPSVKLALSGTLRLKNSSPKRHRLFIDTARCELGAERGREVGDSLHLKLNINNSKHDELRLGDAVVSSGLPLELNDAEKSSIEVVARALDPDAISRVFEDNDWRLKASCHLDVRVQPLRIPLPMLAVRMKSSFLSTLGVTRDNNDNVQRAKLVCVAVASPEHALEEDAVDGVSNRIKHASTLGWLTGPLEALIDYTSAPFESAAATVERDILSRMPIIFRHSCDGAEAMVRARVLDANKHSVAMEVTMQSAPHWLNHSMASLARSVASFQVHVPALELDLGRTTEPERVMRLRKSISEHGADRHGQDDYADKQKERGLDGTSLALRSSATTLELIGGSNGLRKRGVFVRLTCADVANQDEKECAFGLVQPLVGLARQVSRTGGASVSMLPAATLTEESVIGWLARCERFAIQI